ncbi:uncharacterized protein EV422DRAFT_520678 [Fimicolochytrium jonesii]|uniref:uncharacterized protein n=1 Tax=Fimicolochytrium jonesii TaxID=1396493 RepID=UPI0022FF326F|nr:uncharacterized protein EV422DRAFT_520678 [Fimicolochytrium jonesii]KAI8823353.1 hypothetical protein EV422DRAFT_520678 [Fimicolochytrium jonesii]
MAEPIATTTRRLKSLRTCCGCFSLRTGTIILSSLALIGSILSLLLEWDVIGSGGRFLTPDDPNSPDPIDPSHPLPPVQKVRAFTVLLLADSAWALTTIAFSALGLYGAIRNDLAKVRLFAYFNIVETVVKFLTGVVSLVVFAVNCRDGDAVVTGFGKHGHGHGHGEPSPTPAPLPPTNPELQLSCAMQTWSVAVSFVFGTALSVYYAACVYSYFVDLRAHPTKYGVSGGVYLPVHDDDVLAGGEGARAANASA